MQGTYFWKILALILVLGSTWPVRAEEADKFCYPVGPDLVLRQGTENEENLLCAVFPTELPEKSAYYLNQSPFGALTSLGYHLGDDWNGDKGGDTDYGDPVFALATGRVVFVDDLATPDGFRHDWGKVIVIAHNLPSGDVVYSLYAHLSRFDVPEHCHLNFVSLECDVEKGEQIGAIGDANGRWVAHLHLEIRKVFDPADPEIIPGPGYHSDPNSKFVRNNYYPPTDFIELRRGEQCIADGEASSIDEREICSPRPPTVSTLTAHSVSESGATLNLSVNPHGVATSAWLEYGTSSITLDESTDPLFVGFGNSTVAHSQGLSSLQCDTTYYFQAWADGYSDPVSGNILSFRTDDCSDGGGGGGSGSEELIRNGDFSADGSFWTLSGKFHADDRFSGHRSFPGYAYLSENDGNPGDGLLGDLIQKVSIPATAESATLTYWRHITTAESAGTVDRDLLTIGILPEFGDNVLRTVGFLTNNNATSGYVREEASLDSFIGETVRLRFRGSTSPTHPTVFRIDDVSLVAENPDGSSPSVTTLHEDQVESHSARLNMRVNPNGLPTEAWFRWDDDTNLSFETDRVSVSSGTNEVTAHINLDDLDCDKAYYFEAFAENSAGEDDGVRESLRTDECAIFDLVAFAPGVDDPTPFPGGTINFIFSTTNTGNDPAPANVPVTYYFDGAVVATGEEENALAPGEVGRENETYAVPNQEGTYQAWACLDTYPEEPNTSNNCTAPVDVNVIADQPEGSDLIVVQTTSTSGTEVMVGEVFDMSALVRNIGNKSSELTIVRFVADPTGALDEEDLMLGGATINRTSSNQERLLSDTVVAPSEPGVYLVGACVKSRSSETVTSNNCSPDPFWLTVTAPPNQLPSIDIVEPDGVGDASDGLLYRIYWTDSDPDDDAEIRLFYSRDASCSSPVPISPVLREDDEIDSYEWYTMKIPDGEYYVLATIQDGEAQMSTCSPGSLAVEGNRGRFLSDNFEAGTLSDSWKVWPEDHLGFSVSPDAAWVGDYGLRISIPTCPDEETLLVPDQSIFGNESLVGCTKVVANDVDVESGASLTLASGAQIELGSGFSVASGGRFAARVDPAVGRMRYLEDHSPSPTPSYSAEFAVDTSELAFGSGGEFDILVGYDSTGAPIFRLTLSYDEVEGAVVATGYALRSDHATWASLVEPINSEDKYFELDWKSHSALADGVIVLCTRNDDGNRSCGFQYHNLSDVVDFIRVGVVKSAGDVSGALVLDQFASGESSR